MIPQKTFQGRTAYSFVRTAKVLEMRAGNVEVVADTGHHMRIDDNHIVLRDAHGIAAYMLASDRALKKMDELESEREGLY